MTTTVSTPGRICLFGEHQDYLGLPVIAAAISLRIRISGKRSRDRRVLIRLPDIGGTVEFAVDESERYVIGRDYFRSGMTVLKREGFTFSHGVECAVRGEIPINAGTSSSSALVVSWIRFLALMSDQETTPGPADTARLAHAAEVLEFGEPGGMMDHVTTSYGGLVGLRFVPKCVVEPLPSPAGSFVLGNSLEPKDTRRILERVRRGVKEIEALLERVDPGFSLHTVPETGLYRGYLTPEQILLLEGTIRNRRLTEEARRVLAGAAAGSRALGELLTEHQTVLREALRISTPKIDRMLDAALKAGAHGGKINGSGGGGCMFVYAPDDPETAARAITEAGGAVSIVTIDGGTRTETNGS